MAAPSAVPSKYTSKVVVEGGKSRGEGDVAPTSWQVSNTRSSPAEQPGADSAGAGVMGSSAAAFSADQQFNSCSLSH